MDRRLTTMRLRGILQLTCCVALSALAYELANDHYHAECTRSWTYVFTRATSVHCQLVRRAVQVFQFLPFALMGINARRVMETRGRLGRLLTFDGLTV